MPTNLVTLPPVVRTVLYYVLALANAVLVPLTASGRVDPDVSLIVVGVSGVFGFTLAASNVSRAPGEVEVDGVRHAHILPVNPPVTR
jgi:hypothetical protein